MKLKITKNGRGFRYAEFKDYNAEDCSIQESSSMNEPLLWLGCEHETIHHVTQQPIGARMHLNRPMARALVVALNRWIKTGKL